LVSTSGLAWVDSSDDAIPNIRHIASNSKSSSNSSNIINTNNVNSRSNSNSDNDNDSNINSRDSMINLSRLTEEELERMVRGLESRLLLAMANLPGIRLPKSPEWYTGQVVHVLPLLSSVAHL
jgi:hypothetical protein